MAVWRGTPILDYARTPPGRNLLARVERLLVVVAVIFLAFAIYYPFSPAARQKVEMKRASAFIQFVLPTIQADAAFSRITLNVSTRVTVEVLGEVNNEEDFYALRDTLAKARTGQQGVPPIRFKVWWPIGDPVARATGSLDSGITIERFASTAAPATTRAAGHRE
jgi:hypothetical protein